jgi:hypothetical protein
MEDIVKIIDKEFQSMFVGNDSWIRPQHPFLQDMEYVIDSDIQEREETIKENNKLLDSIENLKIENYKKDEFVSCKNNYSKKISIKKLNEIYDKLTTKKLTWNEVKDELNNMSNYLLPSTIKDFDKYLDKISKKEKGYYNILIIGAGPVGLYIENLISEIYNQSPLMTVPIFNILVMDNRVGKDNYKLPYTRPRPFTVFSGGFSFIIKNIYCWNEETINELSLPIKLLENLLYLYAINDYDYGLKDIYFTDKYNTWSDYKKVIKKGKFDVVFDCTGGRLKPKIFKQPRNFFKNKSTKIENDDYKLIVSPKNNLAKLQWKKDFPQSKHYLLVYLLDKNKKIIATKYAPLLTNKHDYKLALKYNGKCIKPTALIKIVSQFINEEIRAFPYIDKYVNMIKNNQYYKMNVVSVAMTHPLKIAKVLKDGKQEYLYIGAGDTIFNGHFQTAAGLYKTVDLATRICYLLQYLII